MNRNMLRAPLIKTATLLAVVSLLVYFTATSPGGSIWSSLGTLFMATLRMVQLSLGLIVSFLFCLAVLTGIFLGGVAMVSRESASNMLEQLRQQITGMLLYVRSLVITVVPSQEAQVLEGSDGVGDQEMLTTLEDQIAPLLLAQTVVAEKIDTLMERLGRIEQSEDVTSLATRLERQDEHVSDLDSKAGEFQDQITVLQEKMSKLTSLSLQEKVDPAIAELGGRINLLDTAIASLQDDLSRIRDISGPKDKEKHGKNDGQSGKESVEHRLFAHLENKAAQEKIEALVTETLNSDMSYAQVIDHLVAHAKGKTADVITAHPSLAKDYIRYRRNNS